MWVCLRTEKLYEIVGLFEDREVVRDCGSVWGQRSCTRLWVCLKTEKLYEIVGLFKDNVVDGSVCGLHAIVK